MGTREHIVQSSIVTATLACAGLTQNAAAAVSTTIDTKGNVVITVSDSRGIGGWFVYEGTEATQQFEKRGQHDCKDKLIITLSGVKKLKGGKQESVHGNHEHYVAYTACRQDDGGEPFVEATLDPVTGLVQSGTNNFTRGVVIRVLDPDGIAAVELFSGATGSGNDETADIKQPKDCPGKHEIALAPGHPNHAHYVKYTDCREKADTEDWSVGGGGGMNVVGGSWTPGERLVYEPGSDQDDYRSEFRIADMNGDQLNDVVVAGQSGFAVFYNQGNGIMGDRQFYEFGFPAITEDDPGTDDTAPTIDPVFVPSERLDTHLIDR